MKLLRPPKLNQKGFGHHVVLPVVVIAVIALIGARVIIASHAAPLPTATTPIGAKRVIPLSIHVKGDKLKNGKNKTIRLLGTDASGPEYCTIGDQTVGDGDPMDSAQAAYIASWHINAVRVPLNEDCWLGINGVSINGETASASAKTYQTAIENWVTDLNYEGIYVILDLHWSAPGNYEAIKQWPMADEDYSPAFWTSVATTFKSNPAVIFDLFNEPFIGSSSNEAIDPSPGGSTPTPWECWLNGCNISYTWTDVVDNNKVVLTTPYTTAGMQQLVDAVRNSPSDSSDPGAGATQPILLGGLDFSGDPCGQYNKFGSTATCPETANLPNDPLHQLIEDYHLYSKGTSTTWAAFWGNQLTAANKVGVPIMTAELGEQDDSGVFMNLYMDWADSNNQSYLAWSWNPQPSWDTGSCPSTIDDCYYLISPAWNGDPSSLLQATNYKDHLAIPKVYKSEE